MSDEEVIAEMRQDTPLNRARQQFSNWSAKIEQACQQWIPPSSIQMRRMEFEAAHAIVKAFLEEDK